MVSLDQLSFDRPDTAGWPSPRWTDWRWSRFLSRHGRVALFGAELSLERARAAPAQSGAR